MYQIIKKKIFVDMAVLLLVATLISSTAVAGEKELFGRVIKVSDGDTVTVIVSDDIKFRVRLAGIDTPEKRGGQAYWRVSKLFLSELVAGQMVRIVWDKVDRYERIIGTLFLGEVDINLEMVRSGLAWHYKKYEVEQSRLARVMYAEAEKLARDQKLGLWRQKNVTAPWDWRKNGYREIGLIHAR